MKLVELTFKCKLITPMFMAGADRKTPELRPSEFKGMMRFWWRAIKAEDDIKRLKKEEAQIFGGTEEKEGRSKIWIRIKELKKKTGEYWPLPHKKNFLTNCYLPDSEFEFNLKINLKIDEEKIVSLVFLSFILGGFGKRSRRGFGSVQVENFKLSISYELIKNLLNKIQNSYEIRNNKIINLKEGTNYPWIKEIEIGKPCKDVESLLIKIGKASHNCKDPSLGNANPRMASPLYVSVIRDEEGFKPIVTTLNSYFPRSYPKWDFKKQESFKEEILL